MKKVLFGLLVLGLTNLVVAQSAVKNYEIELPSIRNAFYLNKMVDGLAPNVVNDLQIKAVSFSPNSAREFNNKEKDLFEVVHKASNGEIIAFYDKDGTIVSTRTSFSNVTLPVEVRKQVFEENEGWTTTGNKYKSVFADNRIIKKSYRIQLQNGTDEKVVTVNLANNKG